MYHFKKGNPGGFFQKGAQSFARGVKTVAGIADSPLTSAVVSLINPEVGMGLQSLKASGVLEKLKK